jgi:hypothetical protein
MSGLHPMVLFVQIFIFLLGVAVGHSFVLFKIHREERRKKEIELALLEKRSEFLPPDTKDASDLEEEQYNARVRQEIDDILRKS